MSNNFNKEFYNNKNQVSKKRIQAKNLNQALVEAEKYFGVEKSRIKYEIVSQIGSKFLSFLGFSKVEIDAWVESAPVVKNSTRDFSKDNSKKSKKSSSKKKSPKKASNKNEENIDLESTLDLEEERIESKKELIPLTEEEYSTLIEGVLSFLNKVCSFLTEESIEIDHALEEERLILNVKNDDILDIFNKTPKFCEALEHLIRKNIRFLKRELPFRIFLDINGTRVEKEKTLVTLALDMAQKVIATHKPIVLDYKNPADRRIIHLSLDKNTEVYTKSIGSGSNRKLMILPVTNKSKAK